MSYGFYESFVEASEPTFGGPPPATLSLSSDWILTTPHGKFPAGPQRLIFTSPSPTAHALRPKRGFAVLYGDVGEIMARPEMNGAGTRAAGAPPPARRRRRRTATGGTRPT